ncbi:protein LTO1 homolog isoform X1 [Mustela nigripes]|uniref:Protein LTO1 homolog isoform X5 n=1 Tax=Mustela putorius furo TaxID=9669 RepID=A0A8U0RCM6_MUSPF|nr:protein LTO1 homolog isoform X5 [Mustela putorius furo]XP_059255186.1 protein LTO1 homolog isoform X1 [Mustela nigripes]
MAGSQDMFDAIVMADERFHGEGYQEGYEEGSSLGLIEGRQHGTLHGARIGSEIGCYQGFAFAWRCLLHGCATEKDRIRHHRCFFAAPAAPWSRLFPLRANLARAWLEGDCRPDRLPRSRDRGPLSILCCAAGWPPARKPPLPDQEGLPLPTASETLSCFPQKPPELPSPHPCDALCPPPPLPAHCPALGCSLGS